MVEEGDGRRVRQREGRRGRLKDGAKDKEKVEEGD